MKRRPVLTSIGAALLGQMPVLRTAHAGSRGVSDAEPPQAAKPTPPSDIEPFQKIAKAKGAQLVIVKEDSAQRAAATALHLDMDMVRASIQNAVARTRSNRALNQRLQRLLSKGTPAQQVEFVHGSGTYYFPEDVEAAIAGKDAAAAGMLCDVVCMFVCWCLDKTHQECKEHCRKVCTPKS